MILPWWVATLFCDSKTTSCSVKETTNITINTNANIVCHNKYE